MLSNSLSLSYHELVTNVFLQPCACSLYTNYQKTLPMSPYILFITALAFFLNTLLGAPTKAAPLHWNSSFDFAIELQRILWRMEGAPTSAFVPTLAARRTEENSTKPPPFTLLPNCSLSSASFVPPNQKSTPGGGTQPAWAFTSACSQQEPPVQHSPMGGHRCHAPAAWGCADGGQRDFRQIPQLQNLRGKSILGVLAGRWDGMVEPSASIPSATREAVGQPLIMVLGWACLGHVHGAGRYHYPLLNLSPAFPACLVLARARSWLHSTVTLLENSGLHPKAFIPAQPLNTRQAVSVSFWVVWVDFFFFASIALTLLVFQQLQLFRGNWLKSCIKGGFPDVWITNLSLWLSNLIIKILDPQIFWNKHVGLTRSYQKWEKFSILNILANLMDLAFQLYRGWLPWLSI